MPPNSPRAASFRSILMAGTSSRAATTLAFSRSADVARRRQRGRCRRSGSDAWHVGDLRRNRDFRLGTFERDRHPRSLDASGKTGGVKFAQRLPQLELSYVELAEQVFDRAACGRLGQPHVHASSLPRLKVQLGGIGLWGHGIILSAASQPAVSSAGTATALGGRPSSSVWSFAIWPALAMCDRAAATLPRSAFNPLARSPVVQSGWSLRYSLTRSSMSRLCRRTEARRLLARRAVARRAERCGTTGVVTSVDAGGCGVGASPTLRCGCIAMTSRPS